MLPSNNKFHHSVLITEADCKRRQTPLASVSRAMHDETLWLNNAKLRLQLKLSSNSKFHHSALITEADCKRRQTPLASVCRATQDETMWLSNAKPRLQLKLQSKKPSDFRLAWERQIASEGRRRLRAYAERCTTRPCGLATLSQDCSQSCNQINERYSLVMGEADCKRRQTSLASDAERCTTRPCGLATLSQDCN